MIIINMQYFGNSGAASQKSGGGSAGGASARATAKENLDKLTKDSSLQERKNAINDALDAGIKEGIVEATKGFPKNTVIYVQEAGSMGYSEKYYTKTGAAGKDGWRDESFEKVDTSSFMLYKNGGAKKITSVHKK